jgi:hypothetical protein
VEPGLRIAVVNVRNDEFLALMTQASGEHPFVALRGAFDMIFVQIDKAGDLAKIARAAAHLKPAGALRVRRYETSILRADWWTTRSARTRKPTPQRGASFRAACVDLPSRRDAIVCILRNVCYSMCSGRAFRVSEGVPR